MVAAPKQRTEDAVSLHEFLKTQRNYSAPCWCNDAPPPIVEQVNAVLTSGSKQWQAIARWLSEELDRPVSVRAVQKHEAHDHVG